MSTDRDMPESWRRNDRRRESGITAAIVRAREAAAGAPASGPRPAQAVDELAERRRERRAAEEARRRMLPPDPPPGPRTA